MNRILIFFLFCIGTTQAQDFKFTLGPALAEQPDGSFAFFNTTTKKGYWTRQPGFSGSETAIVQIDDYIKKGPVFKSLKVATASKKQDVIPEGYYTSGGKNYLIYSLFDKDKNDQTVFSQEFNGAAAVGAPVRMVTFKDSKARLMMDVGTGQMTMTNLYIAYASEYIFLVKEREGQLEVKVFTPGSGELETKMVAIDRSMGCSIGSVKASRNGTLFISGVYYKGERVLDPFLAIYSPVTKNYKMHVTKSGNKTEDIGYRLRIMPDGTALYAGIYSVAKETGYRIYKVNDSFGLDLLLSKPFDKLYSDIVYKGAYTPDFFGVSDIMQLDNGNIILDIEGGAAKSLKHASTFYSAPVYVVCIGADKTEKWVSTIQKYQAQPLHGDLVGHVTFHKNNKVYLVYNDNPDNFDLSPNDKPKEGLIKKNMYVATVEIDENGKAQKLKLITTNKKQNSFFRPEEVRKIENGLFHFLIMKDDKFYFATLAANG